MKFAQRKHHHATHAQASTRVKSICASKHHSEKVAVLLLRKLTPFFRCRAMCKENLCCAHVLQVGDTQAVVPLCTSETDLTMELVSIFARMYEEKWISSIAFAQGDASAQQNTCQEACIADKMNLAEVDSFKLTVDFLSAERASRSILAP
jgi:hypothetical protein